ncbi:MAG: DUF1295 domain-containing protein [Acidobacteriota bacterium]
MRKTQQIFRVLNRINIYFTEDLFGGPKLIKMAWVINFHKFFNALAVLIMMNIYGNFSKEAYIYLMLHGSYGIAWIIKHLIFRDKKWEVKITFGGSFFIFIFLSTYWVAPFILISNTFNRNAAPLSDPFLALIMVLYISGLIIMIASDYQKNITLKYKKGLITNGMFKYIRHPNYLGEMMIYASFALLAGHWIPWAILGWWWTMVFLVNMLTIEASLSRFPEWKEYKTVTGMILPWKFFLKNQF